MKYLSPTYLSWIRKQSCCLCNGEAGEAHHILHGTDRRHYDLATVPVCPICHPKLQNGYLGDDTLIRMAFKYIWRYVVIKT